MEEWDLDVFEKLARLTVRPHIREGAGSTDEGYFRLFEEGERENDPYKIYDFIGGMERGNLIRPNKEFNDFFIEAWEQDEKRTIEILNKKERIMDCVFFVSSISDGKKLKLVSRLDIGNQRLKFELIRQLLYGNAEFADNTMEIIARGIEQLAEQDENLLSFMIKQSEHNKSFYAVMGKALNGLSEAGLEVYADTITMDQYKHHFSDVERMLKEIKADRWRFIFDNLQKTICKRWEDLLDAWLEKEEFFADIAINSYANLILFCLINKYQNEDLLVQDLKNALDIFENHLYAWHSNSSQARSVYFIDITRLYMLKLVLANLEFSWENREGLKKRMENLFIKARQYAGYWEYADSKADDILGI